MFFKEGNFTFMYVKDPEFCKKKIYFNKDISLYYYYLKACDIFLLFFQ